MIAPLALLCAAVLLGITAANYTYRRPVRNLFASIDCIDAEVTAVLTVLGIVCGALAVAYVLRPREDEESVW